MAPKPRAQERFFTGMASSLADARLSHVHLLHWRPGDPSPLHPLIDNGFAGTVTAGRASIAQAVAREFPQLDLRLSDHPTDGESASGLLMEYPPGRQAALFSIHRGLSSLEENGTLWAYGAGDSGIKRATKSFAPCDTLITKGHMRLLEIPQRPVVAPPLDDKDPPRRLEGEFHAFDALDLTVATLPGLFSWKGLDPASRLLFDALAEGEPAKAGERILDLGCGTGVLGAALAKRFPELQVTLSDDLAAAVRAANRTITINGLEERCHVVAEDGPPRPDGGELRPYAAILSNPPFHRGTATDYPLARSWLERAADLLKHHGRLWLVGHRFLNFGELMKESFTRIDEVAADGSFIVWRGRK